MKRDLFEVDTEREEAMREIGRRADRLHTGRLFVEVHKLGGRVVEYRIREDRTTEREVERIMQEPPQQPAGRR